MCGIAGHFAWGAAAPPVDRDALVRTRDRMAPRGPDGRGVWLDAGRRVGLAHRRLAIIDPSEAGAQPMALDGGRLVITFNGEIYNFRELRRGLEAAGRRFRTASDTEVLLHLYDCDGPGMVDKLRGMFAFAIWDAGRRGLFLARDGFGIKPLYYADTGGVLRFASQVKALLAGGGIDTAPSAAGRAGFFVWGYVPEPWTFFEHVRCLPAGCTLWVDGRGARRPARHFDVAAELDRAGGAANPGGADSLRVRRREPHAQAREGPAASGRADARADALRAAVEDTVRHHLVADVPVGAFLSAGLDSATVVAHAAEHLADALRSVTLVFDEFARTRHDEGPQAREIAARCGTRHSARRVTAEDFADAYDGVRRAMDQPSIDGVNTYFVSRAAAETGLKVALSGIGGDELFGGYSSFSDVPRAVGRLGPLRRLRRVGSVVRRLCAPLVSAVASPKYASLLEYGTTWADAYLLRRALFMPWELGSVMDPDLAREGWAEADAERRARPRLDGLKTPRAKVCALELVWYLRNQLLRDADWAGMAHGLEIRTPFVDTCFFRRVAPLLVAERPPDKRDLASTPAVPLPRGVLERPKTGFAVPMREWLSAPGPPGEARGMRDWARTIAAECYA